MLDQARSQSAPTVDPVSVITATLFVSHGVCLFRMPGPSSHPAEEFNPNHDLTGSQFRTPVDLAGAGPTLTLANAPVVLSQTPEDGEIEICKVATPGDVLTYQSRATEHLYFVVSVAGGPRLRTGYPREQLYSHQLTIPAVLVVTDVFRECLHGHKTLYSDQLTMPAVLVVTDMDTRHCTVDQLTIPAVLVVTDMFRECLHGHKTLYSDQLTMPAVLVVTDMFRECLHGRKTLYSDQLTIPAVLVVTDMDTRHCTVTN
uniref:Uncharacterized protein n=1 Tax=Timema genevievae TaxID=629358 RepID=A0A7R9JSB0_TIMGE|nr:unnamed protein product [Timema genevievae]